MVFLLRPALSRGNYLVMEWPLKGYEHHIVDVNVCDRKAYLDVSINGHIVKVGLELWEKRRWFPDDKNAPCCRMEWKWIWISCRKA